MGRNEERQDKTSWLSADVAATVVAPLTLATALLVHFGYTRSRAYFGYFGISQSLLNLSMDAYLLRSTDVTFRAAASLVGIFLVLLVLDYGVRQIRGLGRVNAAPVMGTLLAIGGLAVSLGLFFALGGPRPGWLPPIASPGLLAIGPVILLRWTSISRKERALNAGTAGGSSILVRTMSTTLTAAFVIAAFWASTIYASDQGRRAAQQDDRNPERLPLVTILSSAFIDLPVADEQLTEITVDDNEVHYRYTGLRLLTYSDGRWFLISGRLGSAYASSVAVLANSDSIRVEIADRR